MSAKLIKAAANLVEGGFKLVGEGGVVRLGYSHDDAVENLRSLGEKRQSIAGSVPVHRITKDQRGQLKDQLYEYMTGPGQGSTKGFGQIEVDGVPVKPKSRVGALTNVKQGSDFKFNLKSGTIAADKTRAARDTPSSDLEKFQRAQFNQQHVDATQLSKEDLLYRQAGATPYKEHRRALNSPYWNSKRAEGSSGGDSSNIVTLFDPDFKAFKDKAEAYVRRSYPEYDVFMDDMGELAVENLETGKILGYLNEGQPFKAQLDNLLKQ